MILKIKGHLKITFPPNYQSIKCSNSVIWNVRKHSGLGLGSGMVWVGGQEGRVCMGGKSMSLSLGRRGLQILRSCDLRWHGL